MVVIRLARGGSKKRPLYKLVVADQRYSSTGRFIEQVGFYNPVAAGAEEKVRVDQARVDHWIAQGAQMSSRVKNVVKQSQAQA
ncbi:MAG TPA: 30S ribosomal protein S16 [Thiomicrorhabdus sp.]|nr:30S ribosomal protein S16 [Thiomicrorhabdus sp.]